MNIPNDKLFCSIRRTWVAATPEEYVRQSTLQNLIQHLGFPSSCISVETELKLMPHLQPGLQLPERRADILCYANLEIGMHPLLLIECKAIPLSAKEMRQVWGYNHFVKASFIALVNQKESKLGWYNPQIQDYQYVYYIPLYSELLNSVSSQTNK